MDENANDVHESNCVYGVYNLLFLLLCPWRSRYYCISPFIHSRSISTSDFITVLFYHYFLEGWTYNLGFPHMALRITGPMAYVVFYSA